ncbi:hypothetical protein P7K49_012205 [Saguinus oedipus]|uniref:Uncharacterized protein n=1 Tax=Saguinus oedipus TaxID=9490 RepID=A0ABQ9VSV6_SAGOE|nr:hypothetical protein P7K49_012205 [Saguinus oedipus]
MQLVSWLEGPLAFPRPEVPLLWPCNFPPEKHSGSVQRVAFLWEWKLLQMDVQANGLEFMNENTYEKALSPPKTATPVNVDLMVTDPVRPLQKHPKAPARFGALQTMRRHLTRVTASAGSVLTEAGTEEDVCRKSITSATAPQLFQERERERNCVNTWVW